MAIPMDVVQPIVNSLIQYGRVTRPKLGISVVSLRGSEEPTDGMIPAGVYVSAVTEGGAAQLAGIQPDDIIIRVDGERIMLHTDLTNRIAMKQPGDKVTLTIYRIPRLAELTVQDRVPKGEVLEFTIDLQIPAQAT